jgi:hypothetical protein
MSPSRIVGVVIGAALAAVSLTGCGKFYWGKPGASQEEFVRDNRECVKEAAPTPSAAEHGIIYDRMYRACLSGRGWKREQHASPPPGWYRGLE